MNPIVDLPYLRKPAVYYSVLLLCLGLSVFNLFYNLGGQPVQDWDEARHGVSTFEMMENHNLAVSTYLERKDLWNLKPAMGYWLMALSYKIFGYSVFGMRFSFAFLTLLAMVIAAVWARMRFGNTVSILTVLFLALSIGFIDSHSGRTGDFDSPLAFFTVLCLFCFDRASVRKWWLWISALALGLAAVTKSFSVFSTMTVLAVLFGTQAFRVRRPVWKTLGEIALYGLVFCVPVLVWVILRYNADGFIFFDKMISYDLLQRMAEPLQGHAGGPLYYLEMMYRFLFPLRFLIVLGGLLAIAQVLMLLAKKTTMAELQEGWRRSATVYFAKQPVFILWLILPLGLFSATITKIWWYILPEYPVLCLFLACLFLDMVHFIVRLVRTVPVRFFRFPLLAIIAFAMMFVAVLMEKKIVLRISRTDAFQSGLIQNTQLFRPGACIFYPSAITQSQVYITKVIKKMRFNVSGNDDFIFAGMDRSIPQHSFFIQKKPFEQEFIERGTSEDVLLVPDQKQWHDWVGKNNFSIKGNIDTFSVVMKQ
jgi:4-amino-4-deoxy-L-arabinose transferase-like glycosyltransferase